VGGVARSPRLRELEPRLRFSEAQLANAHALAGAGFSDDAIARLARVAIPSAHPVRVAPGVVLVAAPGHTPGSQLVYVRLRTGRELVLAGDVAWHRRHVEEPRGHPRLSAWLLGEDLPRVLAQLRALHEIGRAGVVVVPSHDGAYLEELVASGVLGAEFE
jgi:glyoxylase-like metal-dependent hydrolase (beta-lactamase superfamily II)